MNIIREAGLSRRFACDTPPYTANPQICYL